MCSYCGCRALTSVARLTQEHEDILVLLGDARRSLHGDPDAFDAATTLLARALEEHTAGEERSLLAVLRTDAELGDHVAELCAEHLRIDAALTGLRPRDAQQFGALESLLRRHIDKEENGLFPAAAIALGGDGWDRVDLLLSLDGATADALARWESSGGRWRVVPDRDPDLTSIELLTCTGESMAVLRTAVPTRP